MSVGCNVNDSTTFVLPNIYIYIYIYIYIADVSISRERDVAP